MKLYSHQLRWANCSGSDLVAMYHVYIAWRSAHNSNAFGTSNNKAERERMKKAEREWADKYRLDMDALNECHVQVNELKARLERLKIQPGSGRNSIQWSASEKAIILKVVIAGAFYPQYFSRSSIHADEQTNELFKRIGIRDPRRTVYFTGFPREYNRYLYAKSIKDIFVRNGVVNSEDADNIRVSFDEGSNKVFVTFKCNSSRHYENGDETMPGQICTEVYKALKMRQLNMKSEVWIIRRAYTQKKCCQMLI